MIITFGDQDTWTSENRSMTIDLEVLSGMEGKKIEVQKHPDSKEFVKVLAYPTPKVRKLFKLMLQTLDEVDLDAVEKYLTDNTVKWHDIFKQMRKKGR